MSLSLNIILIKFLSENSEDDLKVNLIFDDQFLDIGIIRFINVF